MTCTTADTPTVRHADRDLRAWLHYTFEGLIAKADPPDDVAVTLRHVTLTYVLTLTALIGGAR